MPAPETAATKTGDQIRRGEIEMAPSALHKMAVNADDYRHAMVHAGWVVPKHYPAYIVCPFCGARLAEGEPA